MRKIALIWFSLFAVMASAPLVLAQGVPGGGEHQSPEAANAAALFQEALHLVDTQDPGPARSRLQEAMRLWAQAGEPATAAKAALQMGDRCKRVRRYKEALDYYEQAQKVQLLSDSIKAAAAQAIALVYVDLAHNDLAEHSFKEALDLARSGNDLPAQVLALRGLATLNYQQGEKTQALEHIAQARLLNRQKDTDLEAALLCLFGQIRQDEGRLQEAKGAFEEALSIYKKLSNADGQVRALCAVSDLLLLSSENQVALGMAEQAVTLANKQAKNATSHADRTSARILQWRAYLSRGRVERAMGRNADAVRSYSWALNHFEAIWLSFYIDTEASAMAFREEAQAAYREYVDLLMQLGQFEQAYDSAEQAKARTLLTLTTARRSAAPAPDSEQAAKLHDLSQNIARLRLQMLAANLSSEQQAKLRKEIEDKETEIQVLQVSEELDHSRDRLVWSNLATAEQLQKQTEKNQTALAEFSLGERRSFVWLFRHGEACYETLPARKEIEDAVRSYLDALSVTPNPFTLERDLAKLRAQGEALFATLFRGLSGQLEPGQRLIIVPDGLLHYLPFETLVQNGHYLIEDHEISYDPSASLLGLWQDSGNRAGGANQMDILAVGAPGPESQAPGGKLSKSNLSDPTQRLLASRGIYLNPLPMAKDELEYIAGLFPANRRKVLAGKDCTEAAFKREPLRCYRRLHFAAHSLIDEKLPARSAVVLAAGSDEGEDGLLDVSEISGLDLDSDLVVISACQTGRGQLLSGEGVVGLTRAFIYAGARSVIVSLWNVSDHSTGQLMKNLYRNLTSGQSNVAALRQAKLEMLKEKGTCHPYYWSSFVMVGKP